MDDVDLPSFDVRDEPYAGEVAAGLVERVQQEYVIRYGGRDEAPVDPTQFVPPAGRFLVGYLGGRPVACGGLRVISPGLAELKRMYVTPECRGHGLSRAMLRALEQAAVALGCTRMHLETGNRQPEAIRLYETSGYTPIEPYGHYRCEPSSRHYGKSLG